MKDFLKKNQVKPVSLGKHAFTKVSCCHVTKQEVSLPLTYTPLAQIKKKTFTCINRIVFWCDCGLLKVTTCSKGLPIFLGGNGLRLTDSLSFNAGWLKIHLQREQSYGHRGILKEANLESIWVVITSKSGTKCV